MGADDAILFIGGAGFIGSSIIRRMVAQEGHPYLIVLEPEESDVSRLDGCDVLVLRGVLEDTNLIEHIIDEYRVTDVVHLVSTMLPGNVPFSYEREFHSVIVPTVRLMQVCRQCEARFVFFSSGGAIYGEGAGRMPFCEEEKLCPISYYGLSKQMIEEHIRFEHRVNGLKYLIFRPSNPYGPGQNIHGRQGFIAIALGKVLANEPMTLYGDGQTVRDYIYIDDLAQAVCTILCPTRGRDESARMAANEAINIGSGKGYSLSEVMSLIAEVTRRNILFNMEEGRACDLRRVVLDNRRMLELAPMELTPLRDGVKMFWEKIKDPSPVLPVVARGIETLKH